LLDATELIKMSQLKTHLKLISG